MPRMRFVPILACALVLAACGGPPTTATATDPLLAVDSGIVISAAQADAGIGDGYAFDGRAFVEGNTLHVTVQYGGGCARHEFRLFASHVFMESHPVQSPIVIRHNANNDSCRALVMQPLRFDLSALRDAWRRSYQQQHGTIILRLRGYSQGINYSF